MKLETLQSQAVFLFGVLAALALQVAVEGVIPHTLNETASAAGPEVARLTAFFVLITAYYLEACGFFDQYTNPSGKSRSRRAYFPDFLVEFLRFMLFFALAGFVRVHASETDQPTATSGRFAVGVFIVLAYDVYVAYLSETVGYFRKDLNWELPDYVWHRIYASEGVAALIGTIMVASNYLSLGWDLDLVAAAVAGLYGFYGLGVLAIRETR